MIIYLLKSALCLLLLLSFYKIALESEKMHKFKRLYLLGSLLLSFCIPLITISYETDFTPVTAETATSAGSISHPENDNFQQSVSGFSGFFPFMLWTIYTVGFLIFGFRFLRNLFCFKEKISKNKKVATGKYVNVLLRNKTAPHSFLKYIFLNKKDFEEDKIAPEILQHEQAHVRQKHSWDIILVELLQVFFWFNPLFLLYKKAMEVNHEFLADESVIIKNHQILDYSQLLLNYSADAHHNALSSAFNHSLTRLTIFGKRIFTEKPGRQVKKRILMISRPFSGKRMAARLGLLLPVIALCLLLFNNDIVAKPSAKVKNASDGILIPYTEENLPANPIQQKGKSVSLLISGESVMLNGEAANLKNFRRKLNELTAGWTEEEIGKANLNISISNAEKVFLKKLNEEYLKTRFAKIKGGSLLPPPPPEPPHEDFPAPPPPPAMEDANVPTPPAPPAPPVPDSVYINHQVSRAMHLRHARDSARLQETMERRMAQMKEREEQMRERQQEFEVVQENVKARQKDLEKRMEARSEEMRAQMEERKAQFEQRRREMETRRDSIYRIVRDSIR
ncbi:M56 family metallopeptidase [Zunongwangia sp. F363]|uniref:M56 family metallopeptidase n=1 Tax=Autumnicola tepida TaxID=3075595 RepID=A0ABU3CCC8_9FLAO|nr:M56 family metallopeptidase [Zunongwangia sp. F363]MDT0643997.1 M56 family metallopeptidase [Zunongwangia sp. F363]